MKTIISIPPCAASSVLKSLHANNVNCKYLGLDQAGRILMELSSEELKSEFIQEIVQYMDSIETIVNEFTKVINETITKMQDEADKAWKEKMDNYKSRFKDRKNKRMENSNQEAFTV